MYELREYSLKELIHTSSEQFHSKVYVNSINRVISRITRENNGRKESQTDWFDFRQWRYNKAKEEGQPYLPAILTDDAISKIIQRQPINHVELLEVDGIGPHKVSIYGSELLEIIRKNQPDISKKEYLLPPWQFPNRIDGWLKSILVKVESSTWGTFDYDKKSGTLNQENHTQRVS